MDSRTWMFWGWRGVVSDVSVWGNGKRERETYGDEPESEAMDV
jgi:hypothetical protein